LSAAFLGEQVSKEVSKDLAQAVDGVILIAVIWVMPSARGWIRADDRPRRKRACVRLGFSALDCRSGRQ
jgi:hypothetical protein